MKLIPRNEKGLTDSDSHFRSLGYTSLGDAHGIKQGTLNTYLLTAFEHGARILADTKVDRVTIADGRATGAQAVHTSRRRPPIRTCTVNARSAWWWLAGPFRRPRCCCAPA